MACVAIGQSGVVFAAGQNILQVVTNTTEQKELPNDQGYIQKSIVASNPENGEVIVEVKLANAAPDGVNGAQSAAEIFLVIDNSPSMNFVAVGGQTRKQIVIGAAQSLVNEIYNQASNVKIGVVKFSGLYTSISAATLVSALSTDKNTTIAALNSILNGSTSNATNIDAGLQRAGQNFSSSDANKVVILLTDGVPNRDAAGNDVNDDQYQTQEGLQIQANTKQTLINLQNNGITPISMLTGMDANDLGSNGQPIGQQAAAEDLAVVTNIFGTESNPTAGKVYNTSVSNVANIVENDILDYVLQIVHRPIHDITITDFFPDDILDNFDFNYAGNPTLGNASAAIDPETKSIIWTIPEVLGEQITTMRYTLKLRDMQNQALLDKVIATNQSIVLHYTDSDDEEHEVTLNSSPSIRLTHFVPSPPNAGLNFIKNNPIVIAIIGIGFAVAAFIGTKKLIKDGR